MRSDGDGSAVGRRVRGWFSQLRVSDPDGANLRKGLRVGLVVPSVFAFGLYVLDNENTALFGAFGSFAALGFADFGGRPRARATAYALFTVIGSVFVVIGTVLSELLVPAAIGMLVVAFCMLFTTAYGGFAAAAASPLTLAFVLAVMVPASTEEIGARVAGWLLGGSVATVSALVLWPTQRRVAIRATAATVCEDLSGALRAHLRDTKAPEATLARADEAMLRIEQLSATPLRPAGPTSHDAALLAIIDLLERSLPFARSLCCAAIPDPERALVDATADSFERAAHLLAGEPVEVDLTAAVEARRQNMAALEQHALDAHAEDPGDLVVEADRTFEARVLSHLATALQANAALASHRREAVAEVARQEVPQVEPLRRSTGGLLQRLGSITRAELHPGGVSFRNALRGAVALTIALVVADVARLDHAFWVVLGALSVLRSSATRTGLSALQAVLGTGLGFVISAVLVTVTHEETTALWVLLPVGVFLAGYTPAAIHYLVGQASFTVFVVVLFDILQPLGIDTAVVRIEAVSIGAVTSAAVAALLWPRGARSVLAEAIAELYREGAREVRSLADVALGASPPRPREAFQAVRHRSDTAFDTVLSEGTGPGLEPRQWSSLLHPPTTARVAAEGLGTLARLATDEVRLPDADASLRRWAAAVAASYDGVADCLVDARPTARAVEERDARRPDGDGERESQSANDRPEDELQHHLTHELGARGTLTPDLVRHSLRLGWAGDWLRILTVAVEHLDPQIEAVRAMRARSWWR